MSFTRSHRLFQSIVASFYWNVITVSTVGYGDEAPITVGGKVVAAACAISGIIFLAFPLTIFSYNFSHYYSQLQRKAAEESGVHSVQSSMMETVQRLEANQEAISRMLLHLSRQLEAVRAKEPLAPSIEIKEAPE